MRRLSKSTYAEFYWWGCNPGFIVSKDGVALVDTPQQPIDAMRWREMITDRFGPIRCIINTEPHWDHTYGNQFFQGVQVIAHEGVAARYASVLESHSGPTAKVNQVELMKQDDPDSYYLATNPAYPPNPAARTFTDRLELELGEHKIVLENWPGHTKPQTHVSLPEEGIVFTGDNIFHQCMSWLQECDPWEWIGTLKKMKRFEGAYVPGHGEPCTKAYLQEQIEIVHAWLDAVGAFVRRGLTEDEAIREKMPKVDPWPLAQRLHEWEPAVYERSIRNLHKLIIARESGAKQ